MLEIMIMDTILLRGKHTHASSLAAGCQKQIMSPLGNVFAYMTANWIEATFLTYRPRKIFSPNYEGHEVKLCC